MAQGEVLGSDPDPIDALFVALTRFQEQNPNYVPKLGDGVIWSENSITPRIAVYRVIAIVRAENDSWNVKIEEVSDGSKQELATHVVPAAHVARSADVLVEMFRYLHSKKAREQSNPLGGPPSKPQQMH